MQRNFKLQSLSYQGEDIPKDGRRKKHKKETKKKVTTMTKQYPLETHLWLSSAQNSYISRHVGLRGLAGKFSLETTIEGGDN